MITDDRQSERHLKTKGQDIYYQIRILRGEFL